MGAGRAGDDPTTRAMDGSSNRTNTKAERSELTRVFLCSLAPCRASLRGSVLYQEPGRHTSWPLRSNRAMSVRISAANFEGQTPYNRLDRGDEPLCVLSRILS